MRGPKMLVRWLALLAAVSLLAVSLPARWGAQQPAPPASLPPPHKAPSAEFLRAADEVLEEMSKLLGLAVKAPLKKSVRSREEVRAYVVARMKEDREPAKRYADQKALEKFGLIPKGFPLDSFLTELLTEQVAGLYDPKAHEFFIADWIPAGGQRIVMAHELTHALQDQHFHLDPWMDAAKPNDDAVTARQAVVEGAAVAAMLDYSLRGSGMSFRGMRELDPDLLLGGTSDDSSLAKAPPFLRDSLLFPYTAGTVFTQRILRAGTGWGDFNRVFENPPSSTQQVLHPELYLQGVQPKATQLPKWKGILPLPWKSLDENTLGEFGLLGLLKLRLPHERAQELAAFWAGDRYAILEHEKTRALMLVYRLQLAGEAQALRFFGNYSSLLEMKYPSRNELLRRANFFSFTSEEGGVFLRCHIDQCLSMEGGTRAQFDALTAAIGWPRNPRVLPGPARSRQKTTIAVLPGNASTVTSFAAGQ